MRSDRSSARAASAIHISMCSPAAAVMFITGRIRQNSYDAGEGRRYTVEPISDGFAVLAKGF